MLFVVCKQVVEVQLDECNVCLPWAWFLLVDIYHLTCYLCTVLVQQKILPPNLHLQPTRTENMQAYSIPSSYRDYHRNSFFPRTVGEWNILPKK